MVRHYAKRIGDGVYQRCGFKSRWWKKNTS